MNNLNQPLFSLTIGEYIELNKQLFSEEVERFSRIQNVSVKTSEDDQDIIFVDEVLKLTGYQKPTLYSKVCKFEIPVISRRKPLTFSKKNILKWISDGKPSLIHQESLNYFKNK